MTAPFNFMVFVLLLLSGGLAGLAVGQTPPKTTYVLSDMLTMWRTKADKLRECAISWNETRLYLAGKLPVNDRVPLSSDVPKEDVTASKVYHLVVSGERMRVEADGPDWCPERSKVCGTKYISTFNGKQGKAYYEYGKREDTEHPTGYIVKTEMNSDYDVETIGIVVKYIVWAQRSKVGAFCSEAIWEMTNDTQEIDGRRCAIINCYRGPRHIRCWVDPSREFSILRIEERLKGKPVIRVDWSVKQFQGFGYLPDKLQYSFLSPKDGTYERNTTCSFTEWQAGSAPDIAFDIPFPPGTYVHDNVSKTNYIVRDGNEMRIVTSAEIARGALYTQLLATESGMAALPPLRW